MTYPDDVLEKALDAFSVVILLQPQDRPGAMRAALAAAEAAMWRPIETAPKDGTIVDCHCAAYGLDRIVWRSHPEWGDDRAGWWSIPSRAFIREDAIQYWRPLPTPPAASTGRG